MTPEQKIKHAIICRYERSKDEVNLPHLTAENIDDHYAGLNAGWTLEDDAQEFRSGQVETDVPCEDSRHYESKSVAAQVEDGSWVGWTYWFGGGKHGEPEAIDWMNEAYDLDVTEEEKVVTVRTFSRILPQTEKGS